MLAIQIVAIDCLNVNLINQIRLHLKLLNLDLSELVSSKQSSKDAFNILKNCIKHHQIILRLRNEIESIFKYPVLVQFSVSLLIFVMTGFQAIVLTGADGIILVYFYCACITCQLFSYCWFANQVMEENKLLVIAGYNTSWFDFESRYSKILIIFMINAQQPLTFTVGGFFNLSLNGFTGILSRSYSSIAVLRQMYAK
ncbi:unnamed protein product [Hermetia illucens]|uniref:Uncharacterized protein n=1 Tax=Hermetia illucens TaxID=343691 RepID=A0A7R8UNB3_HERIL|nr:putative odorant receptor 92a [Hermetia illucens]CAD7083122.1 unnamed protein product [Hermetia illucens]